MEPLISVVIPVYRVEKYLEQCVKSVQNQTYKNLEIILVDDGSDDSCPQICDKFAAKDNRIRVIHKENGGLADARNIGTKKATGQYIIYVDSDDWIHEKLLSISYEVLKESGVQAVVYRCRRVPDLPYKKINKSHYSYRIYSGKDMAEKSLYQKIETGACVALLPLEICKAIPFPKNRLYEDLFTTYKYYLDCSQIAYLPVKFYYYRNNPNSIMNQKFTIKMFDEIDAANDIVEYVQKHIPDLLPAAYSRKFSAYAQVLRWMPKDIEDESLIKMREEIWTFLKQYRLKMIFDSKARRKNHVGAICTFLGCKIFQRL